MNRTMLGLTIAVSLVGGLGACSTEPKGEADKSTLASDASAALTAFRNDDSSLQALLDKSAGYAVFPEIGKAGLGVGGSYGRGEVFEGGKKIGYADVTKATIGLQIGAQTFSELIVFINQKNLDAFKRSEFELGADVSAVALKAGAAATADHSKGVVVFVRTKGGLMAEASVGGQKFSYKPL
jgi:lipid-binding SYLF domain-containing protein